MKEKDKIVQNKAWIYRITAAFLIIAGVIDYRLQMSTIIIIIIFVSMLSLQLIFKLSESVRSIIDFLLKHKIFALVTFISGIAVCTVLNYYAFYPDKGLLSEYIIINSFYASLLTSVFYIISTVLAGLIYITYTHKPENNKEEKKGD